MGDTGANMAHWAGLYGGGNGAPAATEATVVTAAVAAGTVSSPTSGGSVGSPTRAQPGVEGGRVAKPARRRSRASRRAPVTLLNTDTSNFRAMVQQFTGIPPGPYGPAGGGGAGAGPVISFGSGGDYGAALVRPSPTSAVMSFDHLAAASQQQHHRPASLQGQLFRPQQQYTGDVGYGMHGGGGGGDMPPFLHGFESSAEDRLLLQSIQAAQMMPTRPSSTTSNGNGYNFG
ncbi:VQ motif-containing protein 22-like [Panicum miliaceum]|uniref:VQ motif-containing protein 22-like n=1 Tax=Panicum miliaceum TaxID=4540 RepID=A0A3L6QIY4_PANMI|nr:VQ motif-containing protein 22-like [Panicum miliaceum]